MASAARDDADGLPRSQSLEESLFGAFDGEVSLTKERAMSTTNARMSDRKYARTALQKTALVVGIIFLVVGIAGFIPGLTSGMSGMQMAGHGSDAMLLGTFQISVLHNIVHLAFGVVGVLAARSARGARNYLIWGGVVYLVIFIYGLIFSGASAANFVPLNTADNWLHLVLGVGMILLGVLVGRRSIDRATR
jgi:hypothetical protein